MKKERSTLDDQPARSVLGRVVKWLFIVLVVGIVCLGLYFRFLSVYIGPGEFGVKQVNIGFLVFEQGIQDKTFTTGYTLKLPYIQRVHLYPRQIQVLEFTDRVLPKHPCRHVERAANIQTSDGYYVKVDLSIMYRITNPYKVLTTIGPGSRYIIDGIVPKAEPVLKQTLGALTTEDFYNSPLRVQKAEAAREELNADLSEKGLQVDAVLIRYFYYSDQIQRNIEEKKLKDQLVFTNQAEARAATEEASLKKMIEEGEAAVKIKLEEGKAYILERIAHRDRYVREKSAQANLLVELAEARKTKLKNDALSVDGADRVVGLEMSELLKGIEIIMIPSDGKDGYNPLDIDQTMKIFQVQ